MNRSWIDQLKQTGLNFKNYWSERSSKQKGYIMGTFLFLFIALSIFIFWASRPQYIPLYTGQLTQREVGDIKAELDKQGKTDYQLNETGTMILVPRKEAPNLLVSLASQGYPKDNKINYDIFGQNLSFGATDRQYNILEREAMQTQVADVIKHVDGIQNAEVILTLPENSVFVRQDQEEQASASVMVEVKPGVHLSSQQTRALYTLVSRSVPKLPLENITMMNQYSETLPLETDETGDEQTLTKYDEQRKIQQNMEQDMQRNLQSLLGAILGTDKVYVHSFIKINFDKVKTQEQLVEPTDKKNNGIVISSEKITKSSSGTGASDSGGVVGSGSTDIPGYTGDSSGGGNSSYEEMQNRVNYEVNRINNEIIKSPYQIEDITINVGVEPDSSNKLPKATEDNIRNIVSNTVRTALGHPELTQDEINQRITIFPHTFAQNKIEATALASSKNWINIGLGALGGMLGLGAIVAFVVRKRRKDHLEEEEEVIFSPPMEEEDYFAQQDLTMENQLRKLLEQRPEDFTKIIRTLLHEEEV